MIESCVELRAGVRATEAALLAEVGRLASAAREQPALLSRPVRVIVPSGSLREHVAARLVEAHGALAGVLVQTLRGAACEILRRAGEGTPGGDAWFPVLVRRCAAADAALREALDELHDGYGVVTAAVGDLLDAGLEDAHVEGVEEFLAETVGGDLARRGRGLVRVAQAVSRELAEVGLEHRSEVLRRAAEHLGRDPQCLPTRALIVHGIADVTGRGAELLDALTRENARVFVDQPPDPVDPARSAAGFEFTHRLLERLALPVEAGDGAFAASQLVAFRAPGAEAEIREVGERCARLIERGVRPESIGVVARELAEYAAPLRVQFARLGVPWSGAPGAVAVASPAGHPGAAVLDLLRTGAGVPVDRWLDGSEGLSKLRERDLRLALHALGLARLRDVAALDVAETLGESREYRLPVRRGLRRGEPGSEADRAEGLRRQEPGSEADRAGGLRRQEPGSEAGRGGGLRAVARTLPRETLERAQSRAAAAVARLAAWPEEASLAAHLRELAGLLEDLGWSGEGEGGREWRTQVARLREELGSQLDLSRDELVVLLERSTRDVGRRPLGGDGGGVAVLSVVEARARTFDHLFVVGLNRDRFPRPILDDALLPDAVRLRLSELLPDIPVKSRGFDEERFLFAQLCSAAPEVTLSWQEVSDDGKERAPSPLVQRLLLADRGLADASVLVGDVLAERPGVLVPDWERGIRRAFVGDRSGLGPERVRIVAELDAPFESRARLGPYFGWTGRVDDAEELYVTRLEATARCAWQEFLERVLRLESLPDARIALPGLDDRMLGSVVHDVLEQIATAAGVPARAPLDAAAPAVDVAWPGDSAVAGMTDAAVRRILWEEGITEPGFAVVLARRARAFIERARSLEWTEGVLRGVVGVEVQGTAELAGEAGDVLRVRFRADRVDRDERGLLLTDYKTRTPEFLGAKRMDTRRRNLLTAVTNGSTLQGAVYAGVATAESPASGRYLSLEEGFEPPCDVTVAGDDAEMREQLVETVQVLLAQRAVGSFLPRLVDSEGRIPRRCKNWCDVADACLQHDTRSRHRLLAWGKDTAADSPAEEVARRGWQLGGGAKP